MNNMEQLDQLAIDTMRVLAAEAVQKAKSGHPGMPMGAAPMGFTLYKDFMKFDPALPYWDNRDRFVLSAGHGSMLLYSLLHLFGYPMTIEDIKNFRQWGSMTPGHPEFGHTVGVEVTTGPLGQGLSAAVGMAVAESMLAKKFNRPEYPIVDHYTYVICGDGDLMEGITSEASSLAGHLKLGKLIVLYDDNNITIDGRTDITFTENVKQRYEAYDWHVVDVDDGTDTSAIRQALLKAQQEKGRPSMIRVKTIIGHGAPNLQGSNKTHGAPLGEEEVAATREALGWTYDPFTVPQEVYDHTRSILESKKKDHLAWEDLLKRYEKAEPNLYAEYEQWMRGTLLADVDTPSLYKTELEKISTRKASAEILSLLAPKVPNLVGGSADLAGSNLTEMKGMGVYQKETPEGRNLRFGVREHAMAAIINGMTLHGGLKAFGSTFLIFSDYMRPSLRLSALMGIGSLFILTHDSVAVGEDGPTHQPIEQLPSLEMIPNMYVFRPCDYRETAAAWIKSFEISTSPFCFALSRQDLPVLEGTGAQAEKGAYVLVRESKEQPDIILMGSGSEVQHLVSARKQLLDKGIDARVVSMPCKGLFEEQDDTYKESVLPQAVEMRIAMEAGLGLMWSRYLGRQGKFIGLTSYGASAPGDVVLEKFGINAQSVTDKALEMLDRT